MFGLRCRKAFARGTHAIRQKILERPLPGLALGKGNVGNQARSCRAAIADRADVRGRKNAPQSLPYIQVRTTRREWQVVGLSRHSLRRRTTGSGIERTLQAFVGAELRMSKHVRLLNAGSWRGTRQSRNSPIRRSPQGPPCRKAGGLRTLPIISSRRVPLEWHPSFPSVFKLKLISNHSEGARSMNRAVDL